MRLADFILANIEPILAEWEVFAQSIWPGSATMEPHILRDDAEDVLRATVEDMKSAQTPAEQADKSKGKSLAGGAGGGNGSLHSARMDRASIAHGRGRHDSGFDLRAVISEYRALRASVVRLWRESLPVPNADDLQDLTRFHESMDQSLTQAVIEFTTIVERERQGAMDKQTQLGGQLREINEALIVSNVRQQEMAEQTALLAAIVTSSEDAIISKNLEGVITSWNRGAERLFGYTPEEAIGQPVTMLIPEHIINEEPDILARIKRGEVLEHYETVRQRKDGTLINISLTVSPLRDGSGKIIGASKIARDITQTVALSKKLAEQAEHIAGESRRKDEFLAMLSHELRNPLAPIRSAVHLLRTQERGSENHVQKQAHEIIERQVANLTKLVSDLLEVSRVVTGRIHLNQQTVDMNQVVKHAMETAKPLVDQHKHAMIFNCCPLPVWCNADPTRLEEVFINLLNNAAKYTPDGGRIEVWCEHPEGTNYAQFRVRDNGMGIDKDLLPRIFDLFTQADRSLARSAGGLGIGLSLAHRIVNMHGGTIEAKSPPTGETTGSEFIVRLTSVAAPDMPKPDVSTDEDGTSSDGQRVLVVDDNRDLVLMLSTALRQKDYSVQTAYNGPDGLMVAQQWRPDIVLLDIGLPGLNGYEIARRLRTDSQLGTAGKEIRLIALTGYGRDVDIDLAREAGFNAHMVKPCEFNELEKLMKVGRRP